MKFRNRSIAIALMGIVLVSPAAQANPQGIKVILRKTGGPVSAEDIATLGVAEVKRFTAFGVVRHPENALEQLRQRASAIGIQVEPVKNWDTLFLPNATIETTGTAPREGTETGLFAIQFTAPLTASERNALETAGVTYLNYLPYNGALVFASPAGIATLRQLSSLQWVTPFHPEYRAQPKAREGIARYVVQVANVPGSETTRAQVLAAAVGPVSESLVGPFRNMTIDAPYSAIREILNNSLVVAIQEKIEETPSGERESLGLTNRTGASVTPASYLSWVRYTLGVASTANYKIAVTDTGFSKGSGGVLHSDFTGSVVFQSYKSNRPSGEDMDGHGTAVAGVALGNPGTYFPTTDRENGGAGFYFGTGVAPGTGLIAQKISDVAGSVAVTGDELLWLRDARTSGATVQSRSTNPYNSDWVGVYTLEAQTQDYAIKEQNIPVTSSVGNIYPSNHQGFTDPVYSTTHTLPPATAKNVISVGGLENYPPQPQGFTCNANSFTFHPTQWSATNTAYNNVSYLSRRGTREGRFKPEIMAPATLIGSAHHLPTPDIRTWCWEQPAPTKYLHSSGTSFASPQAAGAIVLLSAKRGISPSAPMSAAMAKAALIGLAKPVTGTDGLSGLPLPHRTSTNPSGTGGFASGFAQGYGRLDLSSLTSGTHTYFEESWVAGVWNLAFNGATQTRTKTFTISNPGLPVTVALAWSDEPAQAVNDPTLQNPPLPTTPTLVNDLDLRVKISGCLQYVGNKFMTTGDVSMNVCPSSPYYFPTSTPTYDRLNNSEIIVIPANVATSFVLEVESVTSGLGWLNYGTQPFAVYVRNAY